MWSEMNELVLIVCTRFGLGSICFLDYTVLRFDWFAFKCSKSNAHSTWPSNFYYGATINQNCVNIAAGSSGEEPFYQCNFPNIVEPKRRLRLVVPY